MKPSREPWCDEDHAGKNDRGLDEEDRKAGCPDAGVAGGPFGSRLDEQTAKGETRAKFRQHGDADKLGDDGKYTDAVFSEVVQGEGNLGELHSHLHGEEQPRTDHCTEDTSGARVVHGTNYIEWQPPLRSRLKEMVRAARRHDIKKCGQHMRVQECQIYALFVAPMTGCVSLTGLLGWPDC